MVLSNQPELTCVCPITAGPAVRAGLLKRVLNLYSDVEIQKMPTPNPNKADSAQALFRETSSLLENLVVLQKRYENSAESSKQSETVEEFYDLFPKFVKSTQQLYSQLRQN